MTPEAQQIAIAEAHGWKHFRRFKVSKCPDGSDYLNDLNAMHSAVQTQSHKFRACFDEKMQQKAVLNKVLYCDLTAQDWADCFIDALASELV